MAMAVAMKSARFVPGGNGADADGPFARLCEELDSKSPLGDTGSPQASP